MGAIMQRSEAYHRLSENIRTHSVECAVIGLGYIGTAFFEALASAGHSVYGYDRSRAALDRFESAHSELLSGACRVGTDQTQLAPADVVVVAVRLPVGAGGEVELEPLQSALASLMDQPRAARLVLVECTLPVGTTRRLAQPLLQCSSGAQVFVAHVPERLRLEDRLWNIRNIPHLVGGLDTESTELAASFMASVTDTVVSVSSPEVSELSKLLENAFLSVGISLMGEVTAIAHRHGLSGTEVAAAAATKPFGYFPLHAGPGIGGHCLPNDLELLRRESHGAGIELSLLDGASAMIEAMPAQVVGRLEQLAAQSGATLSGARVVIVGLGFKVGSHDTTASPANRVIAHLLDCGAKVAYLDSGVPAFAVEGHAVERINGVALDSTERFEYGIILSGDAQLEAAALSAAVGCLLDAGGGHILQGELRGAYGL